MRKTIGSFLFVLGFLFTSTLAYAGGPKTPIAVNTIGGATASVGVKLCAASLFIPCNGSFVLCPLITVPGPDLVVKSSCGPTGFKVDAFSFNITTPAGGCDGTQSLAVSKTFTCDKTGTAGGGIVTVKVGTGK